MMIGVKQIQQFQVPVETTFHVCERQALFCLFLLLFFFFAFLNLWGFKSFRHPLHVLSRNYSYVIPVPTLRHSPSLPVRSTSVDLASIVTLAP